MIEFALEPHKVQNMTSKKMALNKCIAKYEAIGW